MQKQCSINKYIIEFYIDDILSFAIHHSLTNQKLCNINICIQLNSSLPLSLTLHQCQHLLIGMFALSSTDIDHEIFAFVNLYLKILFSVFFLTRCKGNTHKILQGFLEWPTGRWEEVIIKLETRLGLNASNSVHAGKGICGTSYRMD